MGLTLSPLPLPLELGPLYRCNFLIHFKLYTRLISIESQPKKIVVVVVVVIGVVGVVVHVVVVDPRNIPLKFG